MGLLEKVRAVCKARTALIMANKKLCVCGSMALQRDGCQCGKFKQITQARFTLMAEVDALCEEPLEESPTEEQDIVDNPSVLLKVAGRPFRCRCGANVFKRFTNGQYQCNACTQLYEGE